MHRRPALRPALPAALVVGWFFFLRASLAAGGVEYGLRVAGRRLDTGGSTSGELTVLLFLRGFAVSE